MTALISRLATAAGVLALTSACTMKSQEAPPLTGPSEFSQSISITVSPDVLPQDGASQSFITVSALDGNAAPIRNLTLRTETRVGGIPVGFGTLSSRSVVTGSDGKATLVYTAPASPAVSPAASLVVDIVVSPLGTDFGNSSERSAAIRLIAQGPVFPPTTGLDPNFTRTGELVDNQPVLFTACAARACSTASNPIVSYSWNFGDGGTGSGRTVTHEFETAGTYVVMLTVTDSVGRSESILETLTIAGGNLPQVNAVVVTPVPVRAGIPANFNASAARAQAPGAQIVSYTWSFGDGTPVFTTSDPIVSRAYAVAGTYTATIFVTDSGGRRSTTVNVPVTVQ